MYARITKNENFFPTHDLKNAKASDGRSLHYKDKEDVWIINREYWTGDEKTPTKLPAEIIKKILQYSSEKTDLVLDPFLGSGQVAVISKMLGRQYLGFETALALAREGYYTYATMRDTTKSDKIKELGQKENLKIWKHVCIFWLE